MTPKNYEDTHGHLIQIIGANNVKAVLLDEENLECYVSPVVCWGMLNYGPKDDPIFSEVVGYIIGKTNNLIPVPKDASFVGYISEGEDSSMLNIQDHIDKLKESKKIKL